MLKHPRHCNDIGRVFVLCVILAMAAQDAQKTNGNGNVDGMIYKKGERDFTQNQGDAKRLKYDFDSTTKEYTNGVVARNHTRTITGALTGRTIKLPDVNSGYPKCKLSLLDEPEHWLDLGEAGFPDYLCHKRKFMIVIPSTNTTVEADFWRMLLSAPDIKGVGFHSSPILISSPKLASDEDMLEFLKQFRREILHTIDVGMTAEPEYIIMGMSLETFFGGWVGNQEFIDEIRERCGLEVATGAEACKAALDKFKAKTISLITPYQEVGDKNCIKFFGEIGCTVKQVHGLKCGSATDIAHVPEDCLEPILRKLAVGVDAIVQAGTNLSMIALAERMESELKIPIIPINAATLWFALRENGITQPIPNATRLFREF